MMSTTNDFSSRQEELGSATPTFSISAFKNKRDNHPRELGVSWEKFCTNFSKHRVIPSKDLAPGWSPALFKPNTTRARDNVISISMGVLDIDDGTDPDVVLRALQGYRYLCHSTFSHTAETPSYRVIVPFRTPVAASDWGGIWARLNAFVGNHNDAAVKDPSRLYFIPSCRDESLAFVRIAEGKLLDVSELPDVPTVGKDQSAKPTSTELASVVSRCRFMQHASAPSNQARVSEPLWHAMISNACRFDEPAWIHQASEHHPEYDEGETDTKIDRAFNGSPPVTCKRIRELGFRGCPSGGCALPNGIPTKAPAGLVVWANKGPVRDDNKKRPLRELVDEFQATRYPNGLVFVDGTFRGYESGYWRKLDEQIDLRSQLAEHLELRATPKLIQSHVVLLKDLNARRTFAQDSVNNFLCLRNGTLDLNSMCLVDHSPEHGLLTQLPFDWDPTAECPRWLRFWEEVFAPDIDKAEKISFMQEWTGYCLVPDVSQEKFVWLTGAGRNGKSKYLSILRRLVGPENVSDAHIERLADKYVRAELQGKLLNISAEMGAEATVEDSFLKSIVSGDAIEAERKFQAPFSFTPFVRMIGATNQLPRLLDLSDGFAERAVIIAFNRRFTEEEQDKELERKLVTELPGILVFALQGLQRLRKQGRFTIPRSSKAAVQQYRNDSDPVRLFAMEKLEVDKTGRGLRASEMYPDYRLWCHQTGHHPASIITFGKRLRAAGYEQRKSGGYDYWCVRQKGEVLAPLRIPYQL